MRASGNTNCIIAHGAEALKDRTKYCIIIGATESLLSSHAPMQHLPCSTSHAEPPAHPPWRRPPSSSAVTEQQKDWAARGFSCIRSVDHRDGGERRAAAKIRAAGDGRCWPPPFMPAGRLMSLVTLPSCEAAVMARSEHMQARRQQRRSRLISPADHCDHHRVILRRAGLSLSGGSRHRMHSISLRAGWPKDDWNLKGFQVPRGELPGTRFRPILHHCQGISPMEQEARLSWAAAAAGMGAHAWPHMAQPCSLRLPMRSARRSSAASAMGSPRCCSTGAHATAPQQAMQDLLSPSLPFFDSPPMPALSHAGQRFSTRSTSPWSTACSTSSRPGQPTQRPDPETPPLQLPAPALQQRQHLRSLAW